MYVVFTGMDAWICMGTIRIDKLIYHWALGI